MEELYKNSLFIIPILTGPIFVIVGFIMLQFPPKEINSFYGYRTKNSMKDKDRWNFAQRYSSIEMIKLGAILTLSGCIGLLYKPCEMAGVILGLVLLLGMVTILIYRVENAIKKEFKNK